MKIDPAKARVYSIGLLGSGAVLVLVGALVWNSASSAGLAAMAAGLADITIGIVLHSKGRM